MRTRNVLAVVVCASSLLAACSAADPSPTESVGASSDELEAIDSSMHVHWQRGLARAAASSSNLGDHGGRVLPASRVYAIWWGSPSAFPSDAQSGIDALFQGFNGTSFLGIGKQYMRGSSVSSSFVTNLRDSSSPPSHGIKSSTVVNEACRAINANGLTADPSALYFVYTSNFPGHTSYCAFHSWGSCNGVTIQAAYMPNTTGIAGCDPGNTFGCNSYSQGTRSLANVTSHEFMEAITDADGSAWYDSSGSEIGDKCAWQFSGCVSLKGGNWQLQEEWSNSAGGCVQQ